MPVIIIGAGRSGTNILRDCLTDLPGFATWDCDEINPIWRHGNLHWSDDQIPPARATPAVTGFIRRAFRKIWQRTGRPRFVVEKTCANSLRVPFVDHILPEARYLFIVRNGADVIPSAAKRWQGRMEMSMMPYLMSKARHTPLIDLPVYGWAFLKNRFALMFGAEKRMASWGPRFTGMSDMKEAGLEEMCARQWAACVNASEEAFAAMAPDKVLRLYYEDLTGDAEAVLTRITDFLGAEIPPDQIAAAAARVRQGEARKGLDTLDLGPAEAVIAPVLTRHGYEV